ncbi:acyl-CoA dehydrogenase [Streptomyces sp. NPDC057280]|uniref:acyl-CoA dehydrogenase n=1 Tax=Streptomyces sp. NPDC057280 TaxID=3346081 RepID=UPI003632CE04
MNAAALTRPSRAGEPAAGHERVRRLEALLGDPAEDTNPSGYRTLLAADRAGVICDPAEAVLDSFGMNEEFVPTALGGRFDSPETLLQVMRAVFRRDVGLGMGYGMTTFAAANHVWLRGTAPQQRVLAGQLLSGSKASLAQHETAHANDFVRGRVRGVPRPGGLSVTGAKQVVNNLQRADALVMVLSTAQGGDGGRLSTLLLDPRELPPDRFEITGRPGAEPVGLRGYFRTGARFTDCPVPDSALLGPMGSGATTSLLASRMSRTLVSSLAVAAVDTGLRTALRAGRVLGAGVTAAPDPHSAAATLTWAFVDLLLYDSLAVVTTRALHLRPAETSLYAAALKSLLPKVLRDTLHDLASVLGSRIYTREGPAGVFHKYLRDVPIISLGHAGTAACQATIIPQLPLLARRAWFTGEQAPAAMFRPGAPLPPFSYDDDTPVLTDGRDGLSASLPATVAELPTGDAVERVLRTLAERMVDELRDLRGRVLALEPPGPQRSVGPAWFALADRYVLVLAAAAVLGVWRRGDAHGEPFLADPAWAAAALYRIAGRLGVRDVELPAECLTRVHREVVARFRDPHGFDLYNMPLAG